MTKTKVSGAQRGGRLRAGTGALDKEPKAANRILEHLRTEILQGRLVTGTWLREEGIAKSFRVSRSPVRAALDQLVEEGLVESVPYRGAVVRFSQGRQILEVYDVRATLDGMAARLAAQRATLAEVERLREIQVRTRAAAERGEDLMALNIQFHDLLRETSGNEVLGQILRRMEETIHRSASSTYRGSTPALEAVAEHDRIIEAVARGEVSVAEAEAIAHMRRARERRIRAMFS